ncbi:MAG TPA: crotonase/enoyl-CoA hydratase family protein [Acidimicrobiales bacterium]|nr:crotonase/enoyl-CoA hydratase family protein [Acidimicrobiales bacterium]
MSDAVTTTVEDGVAVVRLDDGKANALSMSMIGQLHKALDKAASDATAVCFVGNNKALCAGFDLSVMRGGIEDMLELVRSGGELLMRVYGHPQPTVAAVTGHAMAAGALLVLACDTRVSGDAPAKIGLNEVAIGMTLPVFAIELARDRLSKRYLTRATIEAEVLSPEGALAAGYVDSIVAASECERTAIDEARRLGQLDTSAYAGTKQALRQATIDRVMPTLSTATVS